MAKQPGKDWRQQVIDMLPTTEATTTAGTAGFTPGPANPQSLSFAGPHTAPQFDVIELLPEERKDLLRKIRQHADDTCALAVPFEEVRAASMDRVEKENALRRLTSHQQDGGFNLPETDSRVIAAQQALTKATEDLRRLQERAETRAAAQQAALRVLAAAETWLREGVAGNCRIEPIETEPPKLNKGETVTDAIERLRRRVRELKADLHRIQSAPFPSKHAKARLREAIETLAQRGTPDVSMLIEHDGDIVWPMMRVQSQVIGGAERSLAFHEAVDVVGLFAFFLKPTMISILDGLVDAEKDDAAALSHADREVRIAETMADQLAAEFDEAALVFRAQSRGLPCEHRPDCTPQCILGVKLLTIPRADAAETSPGYSWPMRR